MSITRKIINIIVAPLVLFMAVLLVLFMLSMKQPRPVRTPEVVAAKIAVFASAPQDVRPEIHTFGTTQSYFSTSVASQVGGEILSIAPGFDAGKAVAAGDWLVTINPADYEATLASRRAALAVAEQALAEEGMRSKLAAEDWLTAGRDLREASDLTLRKPQLAAAKANVQAAQAAVDQANLDLQRTTIRAPFAAIVIARTASPGNIVTPGAVVGQLVASERLQVRLPLTPVQVSRLSIPGMGAHTGALQAQLTTPTLEGASWVAEINRIDPVVDAKNQTVYLIGEVNQPFARADAYLPVGAFINATMVGDLLPAVHVMPEVAVVEDAFVWVISPDNTLAKQAVSLVYSQGGEIFVRIDEPVFDLPLTVARRPLASFSTGQAVIPLREADAG